MRMDLLVVVVEFDYVRTPADDEEEPVGTFNYSSVAGADEIKACFVLEFTVECLFG